MEYPKYATEKEKKLHILSLPVDSGACGWMRVRGPFKKITQLKLAEAEIMPETNIEEQDFKKIISRADIIIVRPGAHRLMKTIKEMFPYKKFVLDFDDDVFNVQPSSAHYQTYGTEDVIVEVNGEEIPLWLSGVSDGFNKFDNAKRIIDLRWMIEKADYITAVTDRLAGYLSERFDRDVNVIPNAIDFDLYPEVEVKAKDKKEGEFRIGWCGGASHSADLQMIKEEMLKFLKNTPNATLHLIGQPFDNFDSAKGQVFKHGWLPFQANPLRMKLLDLDVLIAPLEDTVFNIRKDPLKFWDAGGLGLPLVASNIPPFSDVIKDGETGFLFDEPKQMNKTLVKLVKDRKLGKKIGNNAREFVFNTHNIEKLAPKLVEFYGELSRRKIDRAR